MPNRVDRASPREARDYAVARQFKPLLVNTVVGFIGPEYLFDGKQVLGLRPAPEFRGLAGENGRHAGPALVRDR